MLYENGLNLMIKCHEKTKTRVRFSPLVPMKRFLTFVLLVSLLSGCATYQTRLADDRGSSPQYYPATKADWEAITYLCEWEFGFLIALPVCLDLPPSIVCDTVCLPADCWTWKNTMSSH